MESRVTDEVRTDSSKDLFMPTHESSKASAICLRRESASSTGVGPCLRQSTSVGLSLNSRTRRGRPGNHRGLGAGFSPGPASAGSV